MSLYDPKTNDYTDNNEFPRTILHSDYFFEGSGAFVSGPAVDGTHNHYQTARVYETPFRHAPRSMSGAPIQYKRAQISIGADNYLPEDIDGGKSDTYLKRFFWFPVMSNDRILEINLSMTQGGVAVNGGQGGGLHFDFSFYNIRAFPAEVITPGAEVDPNYAVIGNEFNLGRGISLDRSALAAPHMARKRCLASWQSSGPLAACHAVSEDIGKYAWELCFVSGSPFPGQYFNEDPKEEWFLGSNVSNILCTEATQAGGIDIVCDMYFTRD